MSVFKFILTLSIGILVLACNHKKELEQTNIEVRSIESTVEIDDVGPPPDLTSNLETLQQWLSSICHKQQPQKTIDTYSFGLFERQEQYIISLVGTNKHQKGENHVIISIDFEPVDVYFILPDKEYKSLGREQVQEQLTARLKDFTKTGKFQHSFLAKARAIVTEWNGKTIWSK